MTLNAVGSNMKLLVILLLLIVLTLVSVSSESGITFIGGVYEIPEPTKARSEDVKVIKYDAVIKTYTYD